MRYGGFAKEHLPPAILTLDCESCGIPVVLPREYAPRATSATCSGCVIQGPVGQRRAERRAIGKGGRNR